MTLVDAVERHAAAVNAYVVAVLDGHPGQEEWIAIAAALKDIILTVRAENDATVAALAVEVKAIRAELEAEAKKHGKAIGWVM